MPTIRRGSPAAAAVGAAVALALRMLPVADGSDMMEFAAQPRRLQQRLHRLPPVPGTGAARPASGTVRSATGHRKARWGAAGRPGQLLAAGRLRSAVRCRCAAIRAGSPTTSGATSAPGRLGWLGDYAGYLPMEEGVLELCEAALGDFAELGCDVEACLPDYPLERLWRTWLVHRQWLVQGSLGELYADPARRVRLKPEAQWEVDPGLGRRHRRGLSHLAGSQRLVSGAGASVRTLRFPLAQRPGVSFRCRNGVAAAGRRAADGHLSPLDGGGDRPDPGRLPAISVPIGFGKAVLPMGLQIIGPAQADLAVLQLAHAHEGLTRGSAAVRRRSRGSGDRLGRGQCCRIRRFFLHDLGLHLALP